jgi:hypothetical protein
MQRAGGDLRVLSRVRTNHPLDNAPAKGAELTTAEPDTRRKGKQLEVLRQ